MTLGRGGFFALLLKMTLTHLGNMTLERQALHSLAKEHDFREAGGYVWPKMA